MKYQHLFFDLDRTLWDFDANSSMALKRIYKTYKLEEYYQSPEEFLKIYNHHNDLLWDTYRKGQIAKADLRIKRFARTLEEKGITDTELAYKVGEEYMDITPRLNMLAPNTFKILDYLQERNYKLYILTNGFISTQEKKMKNSGLSTYFLKIFSSEELGVNKPEAGFFHWAVSSIHAAKKDCLMIGDDLEVDVRGAMNYGIDAVWFTQESSETDFQPSYVISDLMELRSFL